MPRPDDEPGPVGDVLPFPTTRAAAARPADAPPAREPARTRSGDAPVIDLAAARRARPAARSGAESGVEPDVAPSVSVIEEPEATRYSLPHDAPTVDDLPWGPVRRGVGTLRPPQLHARRARPAVYRLCVHLDGTSPVVWRRLELRSDLYLSQVHDVLQCALGWSDRHVHAFRAGPGRRRPDVAPFRTDDSGPGRAEVPHEDDVRLDEVLARAGDRLYYEYDFGDGWEHVVTVEQVRPVRPADRDAACLAGARACPPEDCGGVWAYTDILDALAGRVGIDADMAQMLAWLPREFDPDVFDAAEVDAMLRRRFGASQAAPPTG